jgi:quinol monooxygenase YgiN
VRFALFGTFTAHDGERDNLVQVLLSAADVLGADPGCIQYTVGVTGKNEVAVFELWESEADHAASLKREEIRAVIARGRPLVAAVASQVRLDVHGGKRS